MLFIPPAPKGMCVHWVTRCATGVRVGLEPTEAYHDPVLGGQWGMGAIRFYLRELCLPTWRPLHTGNPFSSVSSKLLH